MSKSLHNVIFVKDLENNRTGMILRMVLVFTPYRNNFSYSEEIYTQYEKVFDKWQRAYKQGLYELQLQGIEDKQVVAADIEAFKEYMNQDLNVQNVMMLIEQVVKDINIAIRTKDGMSLCAKWNTLDTMLKVLGINLFVNPLTEEQLEVYKKWNEARAAKDFSAADQYRQRLMEWHLV